MSGRGRIVPTRRELQDRIRKLEDLIDKTPCPKCDCEDCKRQILRYRELETPQGAAKIVIEALERMDLPDTARALRTIFLEGS